MNTESIGSTIQAISGHPTMLGYQYLQDAVSLCIEACLLYTSRCV